MHKLVLLDVLCWCFLHDKAQEEVYNQEIHESSIDPVEDLIGCVFEDTVGGHAYDDKIYCPEGYEEIAENLHRLVFLKYRMAACVQPLVVGYLPVQHDCSRYLHVLCVFWCGCLRASCCSSQVDDLSFRVAFRVEGEGGGCELLLTLHVVAMDCHLCVSIGSHGE